MNSVLILFEHTSYIDLNKAINYSLQLLAFSICKTAGFYVLFSHIKIPVQRKCSGTLCDRTKMDFECLLEISICGSLNRNSGVLEIICMTVFMAYFKRIRTKNVFLAEGYAKTQFWTFNKQKAPTVLIIFVL